jgi:hypothetical protein
MTAMIQALPGGEPLTTEEEKSMLCTLKSRMINVDCDVNKVHLLRTKKVRRSRGALR